MMCCHLFDRLWFGYLDSADARGSGVAIYLSSVCIQHCVLAGLSNTNLRSHVEEHSVPKDCCQSVSLWQSRGVVKSISQLR